MKKPTTKIMKEMEKAFLEIQMPRTPYVLDKMVVGSKFTEEQRYAQCVLEMSIAYDNLRIAKCNKELKEIEINKMVGKTRQIQLKRTIKEVELEQLERAMLGAQREFEYLFSLWRSFPKQYTREDLNNAQPLEYKMRLELQAQQDLNATGRIGQGNQEGLRQVGLTPYPELDIVRSVEQRFLENGNIKIMIAVATKDKAENGLPCLEGIEYPNGSQVKLYNSWGRPVDANYNNIFQEALKDHADYVLTVEDDNFPPPDALIRLKQLAMQNPKCAVGGWYPKKQEAMEGVHIELKDGKRQAMEADGTIKEAYTMAMGCSLYPIELLMAIPYPWCKTTENLSQDSFFSQLIREAGWRMIVDTSVRVKHIDRETKKIYQ